MLWLWDLSATLGWAAGGGPGGSWLTRSAPNPWQVRMLRFTVCASTAGVCRAKGRLEKGLNGWHSATSPLEVLHGVVFSLQEWGRGFSTCARGLSNVPISGVQDCHHLRNKPEPLGAFCEARACPDRYWRVDVFNVLNISKSGLLFGMEQRTCGSDEYSDGPASDASWSGYAMVDTWLVGLRLTRFAVQPMLGTARIS